MEHPRLCRFIAPGDVLIRWAPDQLSVILAGQRVALGDARDLRILVVGGNEYVIGLVQYALEAGQFIGVIIPVNLQVQVAAIDPAKRVIGTDPERQAPVVIGFVCYSSPGQVHYPPGGLDLQGISGSLLKTDGLGGSECDRIAARVFGGSK